MTTIHLRPIFVSLVLLAGTAAAAAATPGQEKWKGSVAKEGGAIVIKNPKEPLYKTQVLELKEELSIGGPGAHGSDLFGLASSLAVDAAGSLYILDSKNSRIQVFDKTGAYLRTIGRDGQGPGELAYPWAVYFVRAGGELAVLELSRRISYFKTDGTFLRRLLLKDIFAVAAAIDSRGDIYIIEDKPGRTGRFYETKKLSADAPRPLQVLASSTGVGYDKVDPFLAVSDIKIDRTDNLIYGLPAKYEIQFFGRDDQKVFKKIIKDYDPVVVAEEDKRKEEDSAPREIKGQLDFPKCFPAFHRFFVSDQGHLIVQTWEKTNNGMTVHDIFDAQGRFIGRVPLRARGITIVGGKYYALEEDDDGYQTVKRYAVTWKIK